MSQKWNPQGMSWNSRTWSKLTRVLHSLKTHHVTCYIYIFEFLNFWVRIEFWHFLWHRNFTIDVDAFHFPITLRGLTFQFPRFSDKVNKWVVSKFCRWNCGAINCNHSDTNKISIHWSTWFLSVYLQFSCLSEYKVPFAWKFMGEILSKIVFEE